MGGISELWVTHRTWLCIWSNVAWINFYNGIRKGKTWVEQSTFPCCLWAKLFLSSGVLLLFKDCFYFVFQSRRPKCIKARKTPGMISHLRSFCIWKFCCEMFNNIRNCGSKGGGGGSTILEVGAKRQSIYVRGPWTGNIRMKSEDPRAANRLGDKNQALCLFVRLTLCI